MTRGVDEMDELQALRTELDQLRRDNDTLREQVRSLDERMTGTLRGAPAPPVATEPTSRRALLRVAGAGAVGLVASVAGTARPAAASNGDPVAAGESNTAERQTRLAYGSAPSGAVGAPVNEGSAMLLVDAGTSGGYAFDARGGYHAIRARGTTIGVASYGQLYAFASLASETAAIVLGETINSGLAKRPPADRTDAHTRGELDNDGQGNLWWCVAGGTPGQWRKLAGPGSAGSFHAVTPTRVYDSRLPLPSPGRLQSNENRQVRVADGRDLTSGAVVVNELVPPGASAITGNLTAAATDNSGYLALNEGGNAAVSASALNWSSGGQVVSNSFVVKLSPDRSVTVIAGGGSTHVVIDVTGYFL